ncbi:hypothetical protein HanIR_Chr02g0084091 [Helianthus annuus]|nr:hypothetical protein HanIR_Chr02g0084091 [Helianthus annuus]
MHLYNLCSFSIFTLLPHLSTASIVLFLISAGNLSLSMILPGRRTTASIHQPPVQPGQSIIRTDPNFRHKISALIFKLTQPSPNCC